MKALIRSIPLCLLPLAAVADVSQWSTTPASNNASPPNGAPEGMAPSAVNDVLRQIMADVRAQMEDGQWLNWGHVPTRVDNDTFTVPTDLTAVYHAGRRIKATGSATGYATISSSSYSAPNTTVNVTMDTGTLPGTLSAVYVGILSATSNANPGETAAAILAKVLTVDGASSGLDADLLDGNSSAAFVTTASIGSAVPSPTGTGASGTWAINVTGNAATATNGLTTGNYNSYAPTLTGTGASGTWGISISGNAATATSATSASSATTAGSISGQGALATLNANQAETRNISGKSGTTKTLSTAAPSGGSDGDIWYRY